MDRLCCPARAPMGLDTATGRHDQRRGPRPRHRPVRAPLPPRLPVACILAELHPICRFHFLKCMWELCYFSFWHGNHSLPTWLELNDLCEAAVVELRFPLASSLHLHLSSCSSLNIIEIHIPIEIKINILFVVVGQYESRFPLSCWSAQRGGRRRINLSQAFS